MQPIDRIDLLQEAANTASSNVRTSYFAFLSFGAYLAVVFGATTHAQLLRSETITLPILNVDIGLFGFYWVAPALFVLFHFNLLIQLCLLSGKLNRLDEAVETLQNPARADRRSALSLFLFSQMMIGRDHRRLLSTLLVVMAWIIFVFLPLAVLLLGQISFLPYHDESELPARLGTTDWHRGLIILDLTLLWMLWTGAIEAQGRDRGRARAQRQRNFADMYSMGRSKFCLTLVSLVALLATSLVERLPIVERDLVVNETNLVSAWPTAAQIERFGEDEAWRNFGQSINLKARDLQHGSFILSTLERADLRKSELQWANLWGANVRGGLLQGANLQRTTLTNADLRTALLGAAQLQGAALDDADLRGVYLTNAKLQGAYLTNAKLQGADLREAGLQGSDLSGANLQGADLHGAQLQGALLRGANLQGADMRCADLRGADLTLANLQGADLRHSKFWRVTFGDAEEHQDLWRLADLRGAHGAPGNVDDLLAQVSEDVPDPHTRDRVTSRLDTTLRGEDRTPVPAKDAFPQALGWTEPDDAGLQADHYEERLAAFLGELACADDASVFLAHIPAWRAIDEPTRPFARRLAKRLTGDGCKAAQALPEDVGTRLRRLAAPALRPMPTDPASAASSVPCEL
jgi:uncharacterized protein YjbI with pentapeptide repeats